MEAHITESPDSASPSHPAVEGERLKDAARHVYHDLKEVARHTGNEIAGATRESCRTLARSTRRELSELEHWAAQNPAKAAGASFGLGVLFSLYFFRR